MCVSDDVFLGVVKKWGLLVSLRPIDKCASTFAQMHVYIWATWGSRRGEIDDGHKAGSSWKAIKVKWRKLPRLTGMDRFLQALRSSAWLSFSHFHLQFRLALLFMSKAASSAIWGLARVQTSWASSKNNSLETNLSLSCMQKWFMRTHITHCV